MICPIHRRTVTVTALGEYDCPKCVVLWPPALLESLQPPQKPTHAATRARNRRPAEEALIDYLRVCGPQRIAEINREQRRCDRRRTPAPVWPSDATRWIRRLAAEGRVTRTAVGWGVVTKEEPRT